MRPVACLLVFALAASAISQETRRFEPSFYVQYQYLDSDEPGRAEHALQFRRLRFGGTYSLDAATSARVIFDGVSGTNRDEIRLKDAFILHRFRANGEPTGWSLQAGQFPLPLGYELSRSSATREMPEFSAYNRALFPGEQIRGVMATFGAWRFGVFNSLASDDPEARGADRQNMAFFGSYAWQGEDWTAGVGAFVGQRPSFVGSSATSPVADRRLLSLYGSWKPSERLTIRGEVLTGRDRVSSAAGNASLFDRPLLGWHTLGVFDLGKPGLLFARVGGFDRDTNRDGDALMEFGFGYRATLADGLTATIAFERIDDPARPRTYSITTVRLQYQF